MTRRPSRKEDESGVSVLLEYILLMTITAILFSVFVLVLYTIFTDVERVVVGDELCIVANDVASRISGFSNDVYVNQYSNQYGGSTVPGSSELIDLPGLVNSQQYNVSVSYDPASRAGMVNIKYQSDIQLNETASFHSDIGITPISVYCPSQQLNMYYDDTRRQIVLEGV